MTAARLNRVALSYSSHGDCTSLARQNICTWACVAGTVLRECESAECAHLEQTLSLPIMMTNQPAAHVRQQLCNGLAAAAICRPRRAVALCERKLKRMEAISVQGVFCARSTFPSFLLRPCNAAMFSERPDGSSAQVATFNGSPVASAGRHCSCVRWAGSVPQVSSYCAGN